jgi:hypothetical protein
MTMGDRGNYAYHQKITNGVNGLKRKEFPNTNVLSKRRLGIGVLHQSKVSRSLVRPHENRTRYLHLVRMALCKTFRNIQGRNPDVLVYPMS